jgi:hypothetical protein
MALWWSIFFFQTLTKDVDKDREDTLIKFVSSIELTRLIKKTLKVQNHMKEVIRH